MKAHVITYGVVGIAAIAALGAVVACSGTSSVEQGGDAPKTQSSGMKPESLADFLAARNYGMTDEEKATVAKGDVPFEVINALFQTRPGIVRMPSGVYVMSSEMHAKFDEIKAKATNHEELLEQLAGVGIDLSETRPVGQAAGLHIEADTVDAGGPCVLVAVTVASAQYTRNGVLIGTDNSDGGSTLGTPWNNSTMKHRKRIADYDDVGSAASSHNYAKGWFSCYFTTAYGIDWFETDSDASRRSFGTDSASQSVNLSIAVNPATGNAFCGTTWSASVSGFNPTCLTSGQASATNVGRGVGDKQLSVFTTTAPSTYMQLSRPPNGCPGGAWDSSKSYRSSETVNFNWTQASTTSDTSSGSITLTGGLDLNATGVVGVDATGAVTPNATVTGTAGASVSANNATSYLYKTNGAVQGGSSTIAFSHFAHFPVGFSFFGTGQGANCNSINGQYRAEFGGFTSNTSIGAAVNSCPNAVEIGSINSQITLQATLAVGSLAYSCQAPAATGCTITGTVNGS